VLEGRKQLETGSWFGISTQMTRIFTDLRRWVVVLGFAGMLVPALWAQTGGGAAHSAAATTGAQQSGAVTTGAQHSGAATQEKNAMKTNVLLSFLFRSL